MAKYTVDYFIRKFSSIPKDLWCSRKYSKGEQHCALGHLGCSDSYVTAEAIDLLDLFDKNLRLSVSRVNDSPQYMKGANPKERILNALKKIKEMRS